MINSYSSILLITCTVVGWSCGCLTDLTTNSLASETDIIFSSVKQKELIKDAASTFLRWVGTWFAEVSDENNDVFTVEAY